MLAMADRHGRVWGSIPGLANRARIDVEACRGAIASFLAPDADSRTKEYEGRRIEEIDGGWRLLNHAKYRAIQDEETTRESKRRWWNENRGKLEVTRKTRSRSIQADTEADTDKRKRRSTTPLPIDFKISENVKIWALQKGYQSLEAYLEFFKGRMSASGKQYVDWDQAFMNCVREDWPKLRENGQSVSKVKCKSCGREDFTSIMMGKCERCR